jgi:membrane-associated phospholipid phosphatase
VLRGLAGVRTPWLTDVANGIKVAGSSWGVTVLGLSAVALTMAFRRWRHLLVFLCSLFFLEIIGKWIYFGLSRPRPYGVPIIASWGGYSAPSAPVAVLTIFLVGIAYCLIVPGRPRTYAKLGFTVLIALFCLSRLYLGLEHPGDALFGVALGVAIPVTAFRFFTPNEVFPVVYRRGRTAHVDVTGRRGEAIRQAMRDQLGLTVLEIKPVGLESSAGSTPLRIQVEGDPAQYVFAKLYTKGHVRADRWYKLWRTVLYGSLKTSLRSRQCGAWSRTRTTPCGCWRTSGSARPGRTASWRSLPSVSTFWSPSSSTARWKSARPRSTTT